MGLLVLVQALELLWNLVEASDTALQLFNNRGLLEVIVRYDLVFVRQTSIMASCLSARPSS